MWEQNDTVAYMITIGYIQVYSHIHNASSWSFSVANVALLKNMPILGVENRARYLGEENKRN